MWWYMLLLFILFLFTIVLSIVGILVELIRAGKWIGLGAIFGNTLNNKINAESARKFGRSFKKKRTITGNKMADRLVNFVSPSNEADVVDEQIEENTISRSDYDDFQEYLKWKKSRELNDKINE